MRKSREKIVRRQMRRAHYIAHLWNNATLSDPIEFEPDTSGWTYTENKYDFLWFEGLQLPPSVKDIILDNEDSEVDDEESEYDSDKDPEFEESVQDTEYETD
ncbi:uncharacterized protein [Temnothorax nylanderi]|uniref:uncharacterized protein n=1 Tax=Temnothorax nylanderi TaxID=102681 RepID=UPI003A85C493